MNHRTSGILTVVFCLFTMTAATVAAAPIRLWQGDTPDRESGAPSQPSPTATGHVLTVDPGPISPRLVRSAARWWKGAGANVILKVTTGGTKADIRITAVRPLSETTRGTTHTACDVPCRPVPGATITLSNEMDYSRRATLIHELGHAMGLDHSRTAECSIMDPHGERNCPGHVLPTHVPATDREALTKIWGTSSGSPPPI